MDCVTSASPSRKESSNVPNAHDLVDVDWEFAQVDHTPGRLRLLVGAVGVVLIGGLGFFLVTLSAEPVAAPASATEPIASATATVTSPNANDVVVDTAPVEITPGAGLTPACPAGTETVGTGTLYLGGPASDQNLATNGFIFSLPQGPTPVDVAIQAIALPVIGLDCSITTTAETPSLRLLGGVPSTAERVQVRFKKGDDVWELSADPTLGMDIPLIVPDGEADNFATEPVDWVLFTLIGANERIVGAGGRAI